MVNLNLDRLALGIMVQPVCSTAPWYWASSSQPLSQRPAFATKSALSLLLPNGPGSVEIPEESRPSPSLVLKEEFLSAVIPQGHYPSLLLDYDSEIPALVIISFILSVSLLCVF